MSEPRSKICTKCRQRKTLAEFSKAAYGKFGRRSDCGACHSRETADVARKRYRTDPEYRKNKQATELEYYHEHRELELPKRLARVRLARAALKRRAVVGPKRGRRTP